MPFTEVNERASVDLFSASHLNISNRLNYSTVLHLCSTSQPLNRSTSQPLEDHRPVAALL